MANSSFYNIVQPGAHNGGNAAMCNAIDSNRLPFAWTPTLKFEHTVKWTDLLTSTDVAQSDVMTITGTVVFGTYTVTLTDARTGVEIGSVSTVVHEDTITISGTASDGNYDTLFVTPTIPVRARVTRATTPSSNDDIAAAMAAAITDLIATDLAGIVTSCTSLTNVVTIVYAAGISPQNLTCTETTATGTITPSCAATTTTIAAALEALIQTARATTFNAYLTNETTSTNTITMTYAAGVQVTMAATFAGAVSGAVVVTNVATIPMGKTGDWFPTNVTVDGAVVNRVTAFAGGTPTITATVGDANDVDGLFTSTSIATTGGIDTIAAAETAEHFEAAFVPLITITSNRLFTALTAGEMSAIVRYEPPVTFE